MRSVLTGVVFDIQKFAIHDGPGIRTTVFLKGCPLTCLWCHNPESQDATREISFLPTRCIGCGYCVAACPQQCHLIEANGHVFRRDSCRRCGQCTVKCYAQALEVIGREMTVDDVLAEVLKDRPFYETSGGGMTVSGGEPMVQADFTHGLVTAAKAAGLHVCLDTSGIAPCDRYLTLVPAVDLFLWDVKETDPARHRDYTGTEPAGILSNLFAIDRAGARIVLRCPVVPGLNDREDHFAALAALANRLTHVLEVNILPYHPLGKSKSARTGRPYPLANIGFPDDAVVECWVRMVQEQTRVPVRRG
jgi:pyruvate formate lyase activating enzyme